MEGPNEERILELKRLDEEGKWYEAKELAYDLFLSFRKLDYVERLRKRIIWNDISPTGKEQK